LNPAGISEYLTLSWNYDATSLNPDEIIPVTLSLSTSIDKSFIRYLITNDITEFSIDIHIAAHD